MNEQELILTSVLNCRRVDLYVDPPELSSADSCRVAQMISRRERGEPLQYVLGEVEFMGLPFRVNSHVLIPRPETEQMTGYALDVLSNYAGREIRILDVGTGSGCIATSLLFYCSRARCVAVDISAEALGVARANADQHGVSDRMEFFDMDMRFLPRDWGKFDLIVSNPPYIPSSRIKTLPKDVQCEPLCALDGGLSGLDYYDILFTYAREMLSAQGCLVCEFGDGQDSLLKAMAGEDWRMHFLKDLSGVNRFFEARFQPKKIARGGTLCKN